MKNSKSKKISCKHCWNDFINQRRDRIPIYCSINCRSKWIRKNSNYKTYNVENRKLRWYVSKINLCELCWKWETTNSSISHKNYVNKLCRDHDHVSGNFRWVLCSTCNRALWWYENNQENIKRYLQDSSNFENVLWKINLIIDNNGGDEGSTPS